jgi:redox-sensitive bicupin YhaK (pirin superfamily)
MLAEEQAVYGVQGDLQVDAEALAPYTMAVLAGAALLTAGPDGARFVVIGGQPLGRRFISWNFVSTSKERIEQAGRDWTAGDANAGMGQVPGETERIPLPERTRLG